MIILTGFEKFSSYKINLSKILVNQFENQIGNYKIQKKILPVSWRRSILNYQNSLSNLGEPPDLAILLGIYSGSEIRIERYSWNISIGMDADNKFRLRPIKLIAKLRIKLNSNRKIIKTLKTLRLRSKISSYMGVFLCNYIYFNAMLISADKYPVIFIHIPDRGSLTELKIEIKKIITLIVRTLKQTNS